MLKPSEIIRMAMDHPRYLISTNWLCDVVWYICVNDYKDTRLGEDTQDIILSSLGEYSFLRRYLYSVGKISSNNISYSSYEYKQAAFEHWNKLIEKLENEGN